MKNQITLKKEEHINEVLKVLPLPTIKLLKDSTDVNYGYLLSLVLVNDYSKHPLAVDDNISKFLIFLDVVLSKPELTDKLIVAIQNYNNKEGLELLDA